jgi:Protein of unknown function (DUF2958)
MDLLPLGLQALLPPLFTTDRDNDPTIWVKFFTPWGGLTWYVLEFEEVDGLAMFYGWLIGSAEPHGRFMCSDLASIRAYYGRTVERDPQFVPCPLSAVWHEKGAR